MGGAVHSYNAPLLLMRSAVGPNSDPWIKVDAGTSRGLIILDESTIAFSPAACRGLNTSIQAPNTTPLGLALNSSEALVQFKYHTVWAV